MNRFRSWRLSSKIKTSFALPSSYSRHSVMNVEHTTRAYPQPQDIGILPAGSTRPFIDVMGQLAIEVSNFLLHKKKGIDWHFQAQFNNSPFDEAEWKPLCGFVDDDHPTTAASHEQIIQRACCLLTLILAAAFMLHTNTAVGKGSRITSDAGLFFTLHRSQIA